MVLKKSNDKPLIIFIVVIVLCLFCGAVYFVGGISATTPPIRQYKFDGSAQEFRAGINKLHKSDTTIKFKDEETVGDEVSRYAYRFKINQCENNACNEYYVKYEDEKTGSRISLISAFDEGYKLGGYGIKAVGIKPLLIQFETSILIPLKMEQKINLVPDTSFWSNFSIY